MEQNELFELIRAERSSRRRQTRYLVTALVVFAVLFGTSLALLVVSLPVELTLLGADAEDVLTHGSRKSADPRSGASQPRAVTPRAEISASENAKVELFEAAAPSVVFVTNRAIRRDAFRLNVLRVPQGSGTGFVWDEAGHVVTNFHVIEGAGQIEVTLSDGAVLPAEVVGIHPDKDLAVLLVDAGQPLTPITVGSSSARGAGRVRDREPLRVGSSHDGRDRQRGRPRDRGNEWAGDRGRDSDGRRDQPWELGRAPAR
jgi:S1-C subfamily serine protease